MGCRFSEASAVGMVECEVLRVGWRKHIEVLEEVLQASRRRRRLQYGVPSLHVSQTSCL